MKTNQSGGWQSIRPAPGSPWQQTSITRTHKHKAPLNSKAGIAINVPPALMGIFFSWQPSRRHHSAVATAALADQWLQGSTCCDSAGSGSHLNPPANIAQAPSRADKMWIFARVDLARAATTGQRLVDEIDNIDDKNVSHRRGVCK